MSGNTVLPEQKLHLWLLSVLCLALRCMNDMLLCCLYEHAAYAWQATFGKAPLYSGLSLLVITVRERIHWFPITFRCGGCNFKEFIRSICRMEVKM